MNSKNLRGLREAYSEVYAPQELDEIDLGLGGLTSAFGNTPEASRRRQEQVRREKSQQAATRSTNQRAQLGVVRTNKGYIAKPGATSYDPNKGAEAIRLANRLNKETGLGKPKPTTPLAKPAAPILPPPSGRNPPTPARASSGGSPAPRPASGPVLSKKGGVEGTGVGSNFKARAFTNTEKSRYASVAAQNTTRGSASSPSISPRPTPTAAPAKPSVPPTGTTAGGTKYQIRTPTSAEMAAAKSAGGGESGVRAAVARSQPTSAPKPESINNTKVSGKMNQNASFEWGSSSKLVDSIANAYSSIYESKGDGNLANNYPPYDKVTRGDVIAGALGKDQEGGKKKKKVKEEAELVDEKYMGFKALKASIAAKGGVRDPGAVAASIGRKKYGKEKFQKAAATDHKLGEDLELWVNELVEEGYDLSDYTWDEMAEIYEATAKQKEEEERIAARRARLKKLADEGRVMTSARRTKETTAGRKEAKRAEALERAANAIINQTTGASGRVSDKPMGSQAPATKEAPPVANRRLKTGLRRDTLGTAADDALKGVKKEEYEIYEAILSYLLENNFAETQDDADVIIENMSDEWVYEILEGYKKLPVGKMIKQAGKKGQNTGPLTYTGNENDYENRVRQINKMARVASRHSTIKGKAKVRGEGQALLNKIRGEK